MYLDGGDRLDRSGGAVCRGKVVHIVNLEEGNRCHMGCLQDTGAWSTTGVLYGTWRRQTDWTGGVVQCPLVLYSERMEENDFHACL